MNIRHVSTLAHILEYAKRARLLVAMLSLALLISIFLYHYAARFSDSFLFNLKLIAFASSTILGVVAVLTDFKDAEHKITRAGQWNLAALLLAGAIGGVTLKAEYVKAMKASEAVRQRQENIDRILDPLPETIEVKYSVTIPFSSNITAKALADNLLNQVHSPNFKEPFRSHTTVVPRLGGEVVIYFDKKSPLLPTWDGLPLGLETGFFLSIQSLPPPRDQGCTWTRPDPGYIGYKFDESLSEEKSIHSPRNEGYSNPYFTYNSADDFYTQISNEEIVLRIARNDARFDSARDLQQKYLVISTSHESRFLEPIRVKIGKHYIDWQIQDETPSDCGYFVYRIPNFPDNRN